MKNINLLDLLRSHGCCPGKRFSTNGGEYPSPCPGCGGKNRFRCWPEKNGKRCVGEYWCRGCGKGGDTISFLMDFEGMTFKQASEAVERPLEDKQCSRASRKYSSDSKKRFQSTPILPPTKQWQDAALAIAKFAQVQIFNFPEVVVYLAKRGINKECILKFKLGYSPKDFYFDRDTFGLEPELNANGKPKKVWIPKGIVIPTFDLDDVTVLRLKIRRDDWCKGNEMPRYVNATRNTNVFSIFGDSDLPFVVLCESELDAITVAFYASNFAFAISAGSNITNPDLRTEDLIDSAKALLINYDNDDAGRNMLKKWRSVYQKAIACVAPKGKDVGEAFEQGVNIEEWLRSVLVKEGFKVPQTINKINNSVTCSREEIKEPSQKKDLASENFSLQPVIIDNPNYNQSELNENASEEMPSISILDGKFNWNEEDSKKLNQIVRGK